MTEPERQRWVPPRWVIHLSVAWFASGTVIGLLLATPRDTWQLTAYYGLAGGNALGLIAYVQLAALGIMEEVHMVISHLNNLRDKRRVEEARAKELAQAKAEAAKQGRERGLGEGLEQGRQAERDAWLAWNRRRLEAEQSGQAFTEPPPGEPD